MDTLVLIAVAGDLARRLPGAVLAEFRQESEHRFRVVFVRDDRGVPLTVSLRPELPWVGRVPRRDTDGKRRTTATAAGIHRALHDRVVREVHRPSGTRAVVVGFAGGSSLVLELAPHGANLVVAGEDGRVLHAARQPRKARDRTAPGVAYRLPDPPEGRLDPERAAAGEIDAAIERGLREGRDRGRAVRAALLGVSAASAALLVREAAAAGESEGAVLTRRAAALAAGGISPAIDAIDGGLVPWGSGSESGPLSVLETVGRHHDATERSLWERERRQGLVALLRREIRSLERTARKVERDLASFRDPEIHRRHGEALLAGLAEVRRDGDVLVVPDPYDPGAGNLSVPSPPGQAPAAAADDAFARHRRATRGLETARKRLETVRGRLGRLVAIDREFEDGAGAGEPDRLEASLRAAGIAVGLAETRRARAAAVAAGAKPRIEGVRIFGHEDATILVGKSARDNQHLTFRVAGPEDFWLHALGVTGAHVVLRNPDRRSKPDPDDLLRAAALAAWFSEARTEERVDVQWTRRKYVRKARGGPPGAVLLKRFETVRVRPAVPDGEDGTR